MRRYDLKNEIIPGGIPLDTITGELFEIETTLATEAHPRDVLIGAVPNMKERIMANAELEAVQQTFGGRRNMEGFNYEKHYYQLPREAFTGFSFDEICKLEVGSFIQTDWHQYFETQAQLYVVNRIQLSQWHTTCDTDWNKLVRVYNGIKRFDFGVEGFSARLDMLDFWGHYRGRARHSKVYLDAEMAFHIYHGEKHVLTIGFSPTGQGIRIVQIQCVNKTGNRWIYKLPRNYVQMAVEAMAKAFEGLDLFLVEGRSIGEYVRTAYEHSFEGPQADELARIEALYNQKLEGFERGPLQKSSRGNYFLLKTCK